MYTLSSVCIYAWSTFTFRIKRTHFVGGYCAFIQIRKFEFEKLKPFELWTRSEVV